MKIELIKTTVVYLLLGIAIFTGSAFAAENERQPITVPTVPTVPFPQVQTPVIPIPPPVTEVRVVPEPCDILRAEVPEPGQAEIERVCLPDLAPIGFNSPGILNIIVGNLGAARAPESNTKVEFFHAGVINFPVGSPIILLTPSLPPGKTTIPPLSVGVPAESECSLPCFANITVDSDHRIREFKEDNNNIQVRIR